MIATSTETGNAIGVELGVMNRTTNPTMMYIPRIVQIHACVGSANKNFFISFGFNVYDLKGLFAEGNKRKE